MTPLLLHFKEKNLMPIGGKTFLWKKPNIDKIDIQENFSFSLPTSTNTQINNNIAEFKAHQEALKLVYEKIYGKPLPLPYNTKYTIGPGYSLPIKINGNSVTVIISPKTKQLLIATVKEIHSNLVELDGSTRNCKELAKSIVSQQTRANLENLKTNQNQNLSVAEAFETATANANPKTVEEYIEFLEELVKKLDDANSPLTKELVREGVLGKSKRNITEFLGGMKDLWNTEDIKSNMQSGGANAIKIGGTFYALSGLLGLESFADITNRDALGKSFKKPWKILTAGVITGQVAGLPLLQTVAKVGVGGLSTITSLTQSATDTIIGLASGTLSETLNGTNIEVPKLYQIMNDPAKIAPYYKPDTAQSIILSQIATGKELNIPKEQQDEIFEQLAMDALSAGMTPPDMLEETPTLKTFELGLYIQGTGKSIKAVLKNQEYRRILVNKMFELSQKGAKPRTLEDIKQLLDTKKTHDKFPALARGLNKFKLMAKGENKSAIEKVMKDGWSGLFFKTWLFLRMLFPLIQVPFSLLKKLTDKTENKEKNKANIDKKKKKPLAEIKSSLSDKNIKDLKKDDTKWNDFSKNLLILGIFNKGFKPKELKTEENKQKLLTVLKNNESNLDKFALEEIKPDDLTIIAQIQGDIQSALKGTEKAEIKDDNVFGLFTNSKKTALTQVNRMKLEIKGILSSADDKKAEKKNGKKVPGKIKSFLKDAVGHYKSKSFKILTQLNAPASVINAIKNTTKADKEHLETIRKYLEATEKLYRGDKGSDTFFEELDNGKESILKKGKKLISELYPFKKK